jgi:hypothetical protein
MLKEREIRDQLASYLASQITLADLSSWIYSVTWDLEAGTDPNARDLAYKILGRLAEHSSAGFSEDDLRASLLPIANNITRWGLAVNALEMGSSSQVLPGRGVPVEP